MISTYCDYHLGDHLIHLNYLIRVVRQNPWLDFTHYCYRGYIPQLKEMLEGTGIALADITYKPDDAINVWKNRNGDFFGHDCQLDWLKYHLWFFDKLSKELGFDSPMDGARDFLLDVERIKKNSFPKFDFLVINSAPMSNQLQKITGLDVHNLIGALVKTGYKVITTAPNAYGIPISGMSLMDIGGLSLGCKNIIGVATGPMWPCLNIWNDDKYKLWFLDKERVNISPNTDHAETYIEALHALENRNLL